MVFFSMDFVINTAKWEKASKTLILKFIWKDLTLTVATILDEGVLLLPSSTPNEFQICLYLDHFPLLQHSTNSFNKANFICIWQLKVLVFFLEDSAEIYTFSQWYEIQHNGSKLQQGELSSLDTLLWTKMPLL